MKKTFTILIASLFAIMLITQPAKVCGQVSSAAPSDGASYVVAAYVNSKYYALPNGTVNGSTITGTEISLNALGKVNTSVASGKTWTLEEGTDNNAGCYYFKYTSGDDTYYLYKNGTGKTNYNFAVNKTSKNYWSFTTNGTGYTVTAIDRGTNNLLIQYNSGKFRCYSAATPIILLEIGDVPTTFTVTYQPGEGASGSPVSDNNISGSYIVRANDGQNGNPNFTKENYTFSCWNNGSSNVNPDTQVNVTGDITYTAQWTPDFDYINVTPISFEIPAAGTNNNEVSVTTNIENPNYEVVYYTSSTCEEITSKPAMIGDIDFVDNTLIFDVIENDGVARHAYFKVKSGEVFSEQVITVDQAAITVLPPTFNHGTGTYYEDQSITLTNQTAGASIYYTIGANPADPTSSSTQYLEAISVTETTKIKAVAIKNGVSSEVATAEYTIIHPITIAEAREEGSGQNVTTRGIVTYISGKYAYIQDASEAALCLYKTASNWNYSTTELTVGDDVVARGTLSTYSNGGDLLEISNPTRVKLSSGNEKPCVTKTIAQINSDNFSAFQGLFVQIVKATYNSDDNEVSQGSDVVSVSGTMGEAEDEDVVTFKGNITYSSGIIIRNLQSVSVIKDPTIISDESLEVPNYIVNTPEASIGYDILTVNGTYLKDNIIVELEKGSSSDFELLVSENPDTWGYTMQLTPTTGTVSDALIAVRLKAGKTTVADYSDRIVLSSTDATTVYVNLSGSVTKASVTYSGNAEGVTNIPTDNNTYNYNDEVTVLGKGDMARTGYDFVWWNTEADDTGTAYDPEDEDNNKFNITSNTTLYAIWDVQTYGFTLNVEGDDAGATAHLEVDDATVAGGSEIAYGKEVTVVVNVTTPHTPEYLYSISVNDGAVAVNNNKFTMPAGKVAVTVTTELSPYTPASLTSANMTSMTSAGNSYGDLKSKTIDGLYWESTGQQQNSSNVLLGMLQLRIRTTTVNNLPSYIKLPDFNGKIESITLTVTNGSATSSNGSGCKAILGFQTGTTTNETPIVTDGDSSSGTNEILLNLSNKFYSTGYITVTGGSGAARIWNIAVVYRPYQNMTGTEINTVATDKTISIPASTNAIATNLTIPASSGIIIKSGATLTVSGTLTNSGNANNIIIEENAQLICGNSVAATMQKSITAASAKEGEVYGWYAISSPMHTGTDDYITPANVTNLILAANKYDLFYYNEPDHTWMNYKVATFNLNKGQGYIYRNSTGDDLTFVGNTNVGNATYTLKYNTSGDQATLRGFNLIGNPYPHSIYKGTGTAIESSDLTSGFYTLSNSGSWTPGTDNTTEIKPEQGILVEAISTANDKTLTIKDKTDKTAPAEKSNNDNIKFIVANNQYEDIAYAWFDKGYGLSKIDHRNSEVPMLYIPQDGHNYAIAMMSDETQSFNLNFKAMTTGKYTLSYKANGNYSYLHVIDRLTGTDVDMLLDGEYSFIGSPKDSDNRFIVKLSYDGGTAIAENEIFAFQNGNDICVTGNGELQIFDVTGRSVMTTTISGAESINLSAQGVYIFRLIGSEIKTQKIVVR